MTSLVPCSACARHVRRQEAHCPFCGAARTPSAGPFREVSIPRDAARATIFALGLSLVGQACGGQTDGDNDPSAPGSGASVGIGVGGSGNSTGGRSNDDPCANPLANTCPVAPYGNMPRPLPEVGGAAGSTGLPDAAVPQGSEDAGSSDAGPGDAGPEDAGN